MRKYICDCCGNEYDPDDRNFTPFRPPEEGRARHDLAEYPCKIGQTRNKEVAAQSFKGYPSMDFYVRIIAIPKVKSDRYDKDEPDVCPDCLWKAVQKCDTRPKPATIGLSDPQTPPTSFTLT